MAELEARRSPPVALTQRCAFLLDNLNLAAATGVRDAVYEDLQLAIWNETRIMTCCNKGRQEGFSFAAAADAVAAGILEPRTVSQFISYNREESSEKIRFAKDVIRGLYPAVRPELVIDNVFELEFDNGSRIISLASKQPRGKPRSRYYPDELAHIADDTGIIRACLGGLSRGGVIRAGSTPLGQRGKFHELMTKPDNPQWVTSTWPWWTCYGLCKNVSEAITEAPGMDTMERVHRYATDRMQAIFDGFGLDLEGFQQEHECIFVDEEGSFFPYELQTSCEADYDLIKIGVDGYELGPVKGPSPICLGFDVGRHKHRSAVVGVQDQSGVLVVVLIDVMHRVPFPEQEARIDRHIAGLRSMRTCGDYGGMGGPIVESLQKKHGTSRVEAVTFTAASKEEMMTGLKARYEKRTILAPVNRQLRSHLHAIRQIRLKGGGFRYDSEADDTGHADIAWALALAVRAAGTAGSSRRGGGTFGESRLDWGDMHGSRRN